MKINIVKSGILVLDPEAAHWLRGRGYEPVEKQWKRYPWATHTLNLNSRFGDAEQRMKTLVRVMRDIGGEAEEGK